MAASNSVSAQREYADMGDFLNAAYCTLQRAGRPLTAAELTEQSAADGLLQTNGQTPAQTMKSKISTDILVKRERSLFMRTEAGKFGLRDWQDRYAEHVSPRFKKSLFDED